MTGLDHDHAGSVNALQRSSEAIDFGAVLLIEDAKIKNVDDWNKAIIYDLWRYIPTEFAMLIHADGYIIHPELWNPEWLNYSFIGAPWPLPKDNYSYRDDKGNIQRVGNSVSLRRSDILTLPYTLGLEWKSFYGNTNEDGFLACHHRTILEENGVKFPPLEIAVHFSKEHEIPENKDLLTFAFHSL